MTVTDQSWADRVSSYYNALAETSSEVYDRNLLYNLQKPYPANYFRLQLLINAFLNAGIKRIIEVGVGEGTPLATLACAGLDVRGFDISEGMVRQAKQRFVEQSLDQDRIFVADIEDPITYAHVLKDGPFDGLIAMGVMPHVRNDDLTLRNMATLVRPGGKVFIVFRNKLFSLFTFNRYTLDFIINDLLSEVDTNLKEAVTNLLLPRLRMDLPPENPILPGPNTPALEAVPSRFHNPFEMYELFQRHGFTDVQLLWYHYHPAMPLFESQMPDVFRREAIQMEHETSGWKGYFLCSAFVVQALKHE